MIRTVAVCEAQVPFVHGGAELHVRGLVDQLRRRGFRAEVVSYEALVGRGTLAACRDQGEVRLEGKEYIVQDGDIINFRFAT